MKKILICLSLFLCTLAGAQEATLLERIRAVNLPASLQANWEQVKHSPLLEENLESRGVVYLQNPDKVRWEVTSPVKRLTVFNGESPRRFRLPSEADFKATVLENGDQLTVTLEPIRRDLKQLFSRIILTVDSTSLQAQEVLMIAPDGGWSKLRFTGLVRNPQLSETLFNNQ